MNDGGFDADAEWDSSAAPEEYDANAPADGG